MLIDISALIGTERSSDCVVLKLLACGARGPGFDSQSQSFRAAFKVAIWLTYR